MSVCPRSKLVLASAALCLSVLEASWYSLRRLYACLSPKQGGTSFGGSMSVCPRSKVVLASAALCLSALEARWY